jgi:hypothetical protein
MVSPLSRCCRTTGVELEYSTPVGRLAEAGSCFRNKVFEKLPTAEDISVVKSAALPLNLLDNKQ